MARQRLVGDFVVTKKIGSGSFATVWKGYHKDTKLEVAIKSINREKMNINKKHQSNLEQEISIMKKLHHPNIVQLFDVQITEHHIYLILEFCSGGDLSLFLQVHKTLSERLAQRFLSQLAAGLKFLRSHNLIHRDLKPQNLLLSSSEPDGLLKIADFGFARYIQPQSMAATLCGSPLYMAPEILKYQKYDSKADLWSVGAILYEMIVGKPPFSGANHIQLLQRIETQELRFPATFDESSRIISLLRGLLKRDPLERMSFDDFFGHPFLQEPSGSVTFPRHIIPVSDNFGQSTLSFDDSHLSLYDDDPGHVSTPQTNPFKHSISRFSAQHSLYEYVLVDHHPITPKDVDVPLIDEKPPTFISPSPSIKQFPANIFSNEEEALESFKAIASRAFLIAQLGDMEHSSLSPEKFPAVLSLLIKAIELFQEALSLIEEYSQNTPSTGSETSGKISSLSSWLLSKLSEYFSKVQTIQKQISDENVSVPVVEKLIYDHALTLTRDAALDELMGNSTIASRRYKQAYRLFEHLLFDSNIDEHDKLALKACIAKCSSRT